MTRAMLFVNVGWMIKYEGQTKDDHTIGGHGWLKSHPWGHEAWNFKPYRGKLYGYIPGKSSTLNLNRLGADKNDDSLEYVTVVFVARDPRTRRTVVVGWYGNATVYRAVGSGTTLKRAAGQKVRYQIVAHPSDARLLLPEHRWFPVPTKKVGGNMGESPIWYGGVPAFRKRVRDYIDAGGPLPPPARSRKKPTASHPHQPDPAVRKEIELAAVRHAIAHYESEKGGRWEVENVGADNVGWDLTLMRADETLRVEVKGLSGNVVAVELTPNEYEQMMSATHRSDYVVYVVTQAKTPNAKSHVFSYAGSIAHKGRGKKTHVWRAADGRQLRIQERVAARLSVASRRGETR